MASISASSRQLTDEQRAAIMERARRQLPELDRRFKEAIANLDRISRGQRPRS